MHIAKLFSISSPQLPYQQSNGCEVTNNNNNNCVFPRCSDNSRSSDKPDDKT